MRPLYRVDVLVGRVVGAGSWYFAQSVFNTYLNLPSAYLLVNYCLNVIERHVSTCHWKAFVY